MEAKMNTAEFEAALEKATERAKKELLRIWCEQAIGFMKSTLVDYETDVEGAEYIYNEALKNKDWGDDEEKVLSRLKRKVALKKEHLEYRREQVRRFEKSKAILLPAFKCDEKSTKSDNN